MSLAQEKEIHLAFKTTTLEAISLVFMDRLDNKKPSFHLREKDQNYVKHLLMAYQSKNEKQLNQLLGAFYDEIYEPIEIAQAYEQIMQQDTEGGVYYRDFLQVIQRFHLPESKEAPMKALSLEQSLVILLTAFCKNNNETYQWENIQENGVAQRHVVGVNKPTILDFLKPFELQREIYQKYFIVCKNRPLLNTAAVLAERYLRRKQLWLQSQKSTTQFEKQIEYCFSSQVRKTEQQPNSLSDTEAFQSQLLMFAQNDLEHEALQQIVEEQQLLKLSEVALKSPDAFLQHIAKIYCQKLSPEQAFSLAERMAESLLKLLQQVSKFSVENHLQQVEKNHKRSRKPSTASLEQASSEDYLEVSHLGNYFQQAAVQKDKLRGSQIMAQFRAEQSAKNEQQAQGESFLLTKIVEYCCDEVDFFHRLFAITVKTEKMLDESDFRFMELFSQCFKKINAYSFYDLKVIYQQETMDYNAEEKKKAMLLLLYFEKTCIALKNSLEQMRLQDPIKGLVFFEQRVVS